MSSIEAQLEALHNNKSKKIRKIIVKRIGDRFIINDEDHDFNNAVKIIKESGSLRKFPYGEITFLLINPSTNGVISNNKISNRKEHIKLLEKAKFNNCYIYFAGVEKIDGKYYTKRPYIIDWESVDNIHGPPDKLKQIKIDGYNPLSCEFCGKKCTSKPGLTLHLKAKHSNE